MTARVKKSFIITANGFVKIALDGVNFSSYFYTAGCEAELITNGFTQVYPDYS